MAVRVSLPDGTEVNATTTNVSEGGMALRSTGTLPRNIVTRVQFTLPESKMSLDVKGNIAWADGAGNAGIKFVELPPSSQFQLEKWLSDRLKDELPVELQPHLDPQ
jgi:c-di-GMP-binding flagellar brake protein YcgR